MNRYARIAVKKPREFVLLQGSGCRWGKCSFCDYHTDTTDDPFSVNRAVLAQVTGCFGVLDVINSGSAMELDEQTICLLRTIIRDKQIHTVWFEAHYMYRHRLADFARQFSHATVKFHCGIESFDPVQRARWNKGIPADVTPEDIAAYFQGVCLLCCTVGERRQRILDDIAIARRHFEYCSVNLFCNNHTAERRDEELVAWFRAEVYPRLREEERVEVLIDNTDLGVGDALQ